MASMARNLLLVAGTATFLMACSLPGGGTATPSPSPENTTGVTTTVCDTNDPRNLQDVSFAGALSSHLGCFKVKCTGAPNFTGISLDFDAGGLGYTLQLSVGSAYKGQNSVYPVTGQSAATIAILAKSNLGLTFKTADKSSRMGVLTDDTESVSGSVSADLLSDKGNAVHVYGTWQCSKK